MLILVFILGITVGAFINELGSYCDDINPYNEGREEDGKEEKRVL